MKQYNPYGVLNNRWLCKIDTLFKTKAVISQFGFDQYQIWYVLASKAKLLAKLNHIQP